MKLIAIAASAALVLAPSVSVAQKSGARPDFNLDPNYGEVALETGFTPDPWTQSILAGGSVPASAALSGCEGSVSAAPDLQLNFEAGEFDLTVRALASEDTTLLVNTPSGQWLCDDDSGGGVNPKVLISEPKSGRYNIWLGTYGDDMVQSTLEISELGGSDATDAGTPDPGLDPNFGSVNLETGFTPDPHEKTILAGGSIPAASAKSGCEGKVSAAADYQVVFEPGSMDLTFLVEASEDTTLLINAPNGRWYCDDDSGGGVNPKVLITNPQAGRYDVWVGTYGDDMVQSTLKVSELD
ncbi:hypothetical protein [Brevundimonas sp. SL130]|uniref:hypothetical protein n=1 Tax=Brevundimonas sp. SL130 TaxID=2995143 RepID=UPI00226C7D1F|nr:hypothetical protein [Brevundimonas sp. SL130]WAC59656.1 hypothetical protein OU998_15785 [Brevundimonas sp. SL130]